MSIVTVPRVLRDKLGDDATEALVELMNQAKRENREDVISLVEERFERRLSEEISKVRVELAEVKSDLIRWMFIFWIGQIGVLTGILFAFFKS